MKPLIQTLSLMVAVSILGFTAACTPAIAPTTNPTSEPTVTAAASPTPAPHSTAEPSPTTPQSSLGPESLAPLAGRIFCGSSAAGTVLGCSRDGTRLLIQKSRENLFVLHADGSETQVAEQLSGITGFGGSSGPQGATISPDGSRVVFAGLTKPAEEGRACHDGALFAVDADGGPAELLWESQRARMVRYPIFSPDGTQVAFADGNCDSDHSVWVMNADGSDAHQIVPSEIGPLSATHVYGLAWSPAGDRIALSVRGGTYTFTTDGSDFARDSDTSDFCWPGWRC